MNGERYKVAAIRWCGLVVALAALALGACATGGQEQGSSVSRVWSTSAGAFVDSARAMAAVRNADVILLGESHSVAAHHRLQRRLIEAAASQGRPAIVFEMIRRDQQGAIHKWRGDGADSTAFGSAVEWEKRGWPPWSLYRPIVEAAVTHALPIYGGAPPKAALRRVSHEGLSALDPNRRRTLGLAQPLPEAGRQRLLTTLRAAHCSTKGKERVIAAMAAVQRLRDAYFAERLRAAVHTHGAAVLIAGRGHTRADHGVPLYLEDRLDSRQLVTVGFAGTGEFSDIDALRRAQGGTLGHDYIWLTSGGEPAPDCEDGTAGR